MAVTHYGTRAGRRICDLDLSAEQADIAAVEANVATLQTNVTALQAFDTALQSAWTAYTPSLGAGSGSFTSATAAGRYKTVGKTTFVTVTITITTNGTASLFITASLPNTANANAIVVGRSIFGSGNALTGIVALGAPQQITITNYNNTYPGANGEILVVSGVYENT